MGSDAKRDPEGPEARVTGGPGRRHRTRLQQHPNRDPRQPLLRGTDAGGKPPGPRPGQERRKGFAARRRARAPAPHFFQRGAADQEGGIGRKTCAGIPLPRAARHQGADESGTSRRPAHHRGGRGADKPGLQQRDHQRLPGHARRGRPLGAGAKSRAPRGEPHDAAGGGVRAGLLHR